MQSALIRSVTSMRQLLLTLFCQGALWSVFGSAYVRYIGCRLIDMALGPTYPSHLSDTVLSHPLSHIQTGHFSGAWFALYPASIETRRPMQTISDLRPDTCFVHWENSI
ncbi:hypothetical protein EV363DRAFT_519989 [Boletus edulis]|uniref:Uncharacterized protein n=1 Tax=Boletus edulis BED1 TaxID=1328754 RepID=A0AAD4C6I7_BOLED|nr:hypothetical protein EV363DRAFT_519989 [Boletus edulis]KAF8450704.1 hypothetical protein L210DRAFT_2406550 [Boletus edulis BED1]